MIIIIAKFKVEEDKKEEVVLKTEDLINKSRKDEGNIEYDLLINPDNGIFQFVEQWESEEMLKKHMQSKHFIEFMKLNETGIITDKGTNLFDAKKI